MVLRACACGGHVPCRLRACVQLRAPCRRIFLLKILRNCLRRGGSPGQDTKRHVGMTLGQGHGPRHGLSGDRARAEDDRLQEACRQGLQHHDGWQHVCPDLAEGARGGKMYGSVAHLHGLGQPGGQPHQLHHRSLIISSLKTLSSSSPDGGLKLFDCIASVMQPGGVDSVQGAKFSTFREEIRRVRQKSLVLVTTRSAAATV